MTTLAAILRTAADSIDPAPITAWLVLIATAFAIIAAAALAAWGGSSGTSSPLHYQAATDVTTRMTFIQDTPTRWRATIESTSSATTIACSALGYISTAMDDLTIGLSTGTFTGDWALYKRSRT